MGRFRNLMEDAKKYVGVQPYDLYYKDDKEFYNECVLLHGKESFDEMVSIVRETQEKTN